mmetsp:Transcript_69340/g.215151  ORF Transcript_69340/g.215151 Transcript_69340/m.215151 type:complete len:289 (-) Transcript_69340:109-975(-)
MGGECLRHSRAQDVGTTQVVPSVAAAEILEARHVQHEATKELVGDVRRAVDVDRAELAALGEHADEGVLNQLVLERELQGLETPALTERLDTGDRQGASDHQRLEVARAHHRSQPQVGDIDEHKAAEPWPGAAENWCQCGTSDLRSSEVTVADAEVGQRCPVQLQGSQHASVREERAAEHQPPDVAWGSTSERKAEVLVRHVPVPEGSAVVPLCANITAVPGFLASTTCRRDVSDQGRAGAFHHLGVLAAHTYALQQLRSPCLQLPLQNSLVLSASALQRGGPTCQGR